MVGTTGDGYSVLMSVYHKENPAFLHSSMESIFAQTRPTDDFVLVCDGPLTPGLNAVIDEMAMAHGGVLHLVRLAKNGGLGNALQAGLARCKHELIARMDSDDISLPDRCERQVAVFRQNPQLALVSGTVLEFQVSPKAITGKRQLPEGHGALCEFSRKRNPFNHPAVMFKKTEVEKAGGYSEAYPLFEDYHLWIRMLMNGCQGYNLQRPVLYMRAPQDMYLRRGGKKYAGDMLRFHRWMWTSGWSNGWVYLTGALPHAAVCLMPNRLRGSIYKALH